MKLYALNISEDGRILSACVGLLNGNYDNMPRVDYLPEGNIYEYRYIVNENLDTGELTWEYIHDPLPEPAVEEKPSQLDIIEAQVTYTAMMTDTLLEV